MESFCCSCLCLLRPLCLRGDEVAGSSCQWALFAHLHQPHEGLCFSIFPNILCESLLCLWRKSLQDSMTSPPFIFLVPTTSHSHASPHPAFRNYFKPLAIISHPFLGHPLFSAPVSDSEVPLSLRQSLFIKISTYLTAQ